MTATQPPTRVTDGQIVPTSESLHKKEVKIPNDNEYNQLRRKDNVAFASALTLPTKILSTAGYYGSAFHMQNCLTGPIVSSVIFGTLFAGMDAMQGTQKFTPRTAVQYSGFLYVYNAMQCPMQAIHGRDSLLHNALAGGTLGYIGVSSGRLGIPFVNPYALYASGYNLSPAVLGFVVYAGIGAAFGILNGKSI